METGKKHNTRVSEFYEGKSMFITGAAGFLGSVLLEILLRCLPGIKNIFILLRSKKGICPEERKKLLFQKKIFGEILKENPNISDKVIVIEGDVSQPNVGMSDVDTAKVAKEASIIFHAAATISFLKRLRFTALNNCVGTKHVIELARKFKKLDVLVYTSSAYSNSNRHPKIEEIVYRLPWTAEKFLKELETSGTGEFENLVADCKPDWPNDYTFSKCLAENILADLASDLPVAIIRPSIIAASWKNSLFGYIEEGTGLVDFSLAVGKGFARVVQANPKSRFDLIPVDIVANVHIVGAWSVATKRLASPSVINCTGGPWKVSFGTFCETLKEVAFVQLVPRCFQKPSFTIVQNKFLFTLLSGYEHYLPAYFLDLIFKLRGSNLRLVKMYNFLGLVMKQLNFFMSTTFDFEMDNYNLIIEQMDPRDKEIFSIRTDELDIKELVQAIPKVNSFYNWELADKRSPKKREQLVFKRTLIINFIKIGTLLFLFFILFKILYYMLILIVL